MKSLHIKSIKSSELFRTGFVDGLGAPALLFSDFVCPTIKIYTSNISKQPENKLSGLSQDWARIGGDFQVVMKRYA